MKCFCSRLPALAALALALLAVPARSETVAFSYSWKMLPSVDVMGERFVVAATVDAAPPGSSSIEAGGTRDIPAASFATAMVPGGSDDVFDAPFALRLTLTDTASGQSAYYLFDGRLRGGIGSDYSDLKADFDLSTVRTAILVGRTYEVSLNLASVKLPAPFDPPETSLSARVSVVGTGGSGDPETLETPEPGTAVLAAIGAAGIAHRLGLRRKKA